MKHQTRTHLLVPWLGPVAALCVALLPVPVDGQSEYSLAEPPSWVVPVEPLERSGHTGAGEDQDNRDTELILISLQDRAAGPDSESYVRLRYRVRGLGAVQENSQVEIGFNPAYQDLVLHSVVVSRNGRSVPQLTPSQVRIYDDESRLSGYVVQGRKTAVILLEDVRVGDVIDYSYTVRGANPVFGPHYSREFPLGTTATVARLHVRLLWEGATEPRFKPHRTDVQPEVRRLGRAVEYVWDMRDTEPVRWEPLTPSWYRATPAVRVSDFASWSEVAAWGRDLFQTSGGLPDELARLAQKLRKSHSAPLPRAEAALRFAQDEIRYLAVALGENSHRPYPPGEVLARRYGDCKDKSLLLVTLLEAVGIEAYPALVSTIHREHVSEFNPSAGVFDHVVVLIRIGDEEYWVDPTRLLDREPLRPGTSPYGAALVLAGDTEGMSRMPLPEAAQPEREVLTRLDLGLPDKATTMTVETTYRRDSATGLRDFFQDTPIEEITQGYVEFYAELYPGVTSLGPIEIRDDEGANEIVVTERYDVEEFWYAADGDSELVGELYPLEVSASLPSSGSGRRTMPLALEHPIWVRSVIEARIEEGWAIAPEQAAIDIPGGSFRYDAEVTDEVLRLTHEYRSTADHVPPEASIEHQRGLERISSQLGFVVTPPPAISDTVVYLVMLLLILLTGIAIEVARKIAARS